MNYETIETRLQQGIALIWLNRPDVRNAMSDAMLAELNDAIDAATDDETVRVIVLAGRGTAFCAGADLNWMKKARSMTPEAAIADSAPLANLLRKLYAGPKPTVARVQGPAYAGGMGLVAACDIAIASTEAKFCLSEVRLGMIPSMISPYVIKAIGEAPSRRYFLTGEVFDSAEAYRIGFVHDIVPPEELDAKVNALLGHLVQGGPNALGECKRLVRDMVGRPIDDAIVADTAGRIARARATDEAQEGIAAFFAKRKPSWVPAG